MKKEPEKADWCTEEGFEKRPSTKRINESRTSHELIALIEADSSNLRIPNFPQAESNFLFLVGTVIFFYAITLIGFLLNLADVTVIIYFFGIVPILLFASLCLCSGCCYAFEKIYYGLIMNNIGLAWRSFRDVAIEWGHIESIDVWYKNDSISRIHFFGNERIIMHKNSRWSRKVTLDLICSYIPSFSNWHIGREPSWTEGTYRYSRFESKDSTDEAVEEPF
ncbi:MAG: hypothetical protein ACXABF_01360 [Candidatus Thorarchaeota archaeon]